MAMKDICPTAAIERLTDELLREGYCIIPQALGAATIGAFEADLERAFEETPFCQGGFYGQTTKRFSRLLLRSPHAATLVQQQLILGVARRVLGPWCDRIQLNVTQAIAVHPGAPAQLPHRDQKRVLKPGAASATRQGDYIK
jgi:hypothetical protein